MKVKTLLLSMACVTAMTIGMTEGASARPSHHHHRHTHHAQVHRHHVKHVVRHRIRKEPEAQTESVSIFAGRGLGGNAIVSEARQYIGSGPKFGRKSLWCARFMNYVLEKAGFHGSGSDMASSFYRYGHRVSGPQVGAIAVMGRRGGGHVGVVSGVDEHGNPIIISGNHGNRVEEATYSARRHITYVVPNG